MERRIRLITGLTLFAYATCHFLSHATGIFGLRILDGVGRGIILWPWQTLVGHGAVFTALFTHAGLGLRALYRRRHLRIPASEAWQLGLGLSLPLLLIPHAVDVRLGKAVYGLDDTYYRILYYYWMTVPAVGLTRQMVLLGFAWSHGCIGLHFLLRYRPWYPPIRRALFVVALLVPALAVLGLVNAGWNTELKSVVDPGFVALHGPPAAGSSGAAAAASLNGIWDAAQIVYVGLVVLVLAARIVRDHYWRRRGRLSFSYPNGLVVAVPRGFSILEASRWAGVPHASMCGGRARCSTCRVRVAAVANALPDASDIERRTLDFIRAPANIRLGCQLRPSADVAVVPLLPSDVTARGITVAGQFGRETTITALSIDLRDSTRLAAERLPFDALFIADSYVRRVTATVRRFGGEVTSIAGDGIMVIFGNRDDAARGAQAAIHAAFTLCEELDELSREMAAELTSPLRFGIGLHSGIAAVGTIIESGRPAVLFLGDTGNVAARLERLTKDHGSRVIVSRAVFDTAGREPPAGVPMIDVQIRGRERQLLTIVLFDELAVGAATSVLAEVTADGQE